MASLILLIIFGLGVAYFATQNTGNVHILIGTYLVSGIPLYIVVVGSILFGVFVSWIVSVVNAISTLIALHGKDIALKHAQETIKVLEEENSQLRTHAPHTEEIIIHNKENSQENQQDTFSSFLHKFRLDFGLFS